MRRLRLPWRAEAGAVRPLLASLAARLAGGVRDRDLEARHRGHQRPRPLRGRDRRDRPPHSLRRDRPSAGGAPAAVETARDLLPHRPDEHDGRAHAGTARLPRHHGAAWGNAGVGALRTPASRPPALSRASRVAAPSLAVWAMSSEAVAGLWP